MDVVQGRMEARSLSDFAQHLACGDGADNSIVVTFDDGYADNLHAALPILEERNIPATVFVVSGLVGVDDGFWWEVLNRVFLETQTLPEALELRTSLGTKSWHLGECARYTPCDLNRSACWSADEEPPRDRRQESFLQVWEFLLALGQEERREVLAGVVQWASLPPLSEADGRPRPVNKAELYRLAASTLIEIGGHTVSHADLSALSKSRAQAEIRDDRVALIKMTSQSVETFAYPFGRFSEETASHITEAGYTCASCSKYGAASMAHNQFYLPRIQVPNISGPEFRQLLHNLLGPASPLADRNSSDRFSMNQAPD